MTETIHIHDVHDLATSGSAQHAIREAAKNVGLTQLEMIDFVADHLQSVSPGLDAATAKRAAKKAIKLYDRRSYQ